MDSRQHGDETLIAELLTLPTRFKTERDSTFRFDEEPHLYWLKQRTRWSATGMLKAVGYIDDRFFTPESAENGRRRHKATQLVDAIGDVNRIRIADEDLGYVEGWRKFVREWNFRPRLIETPMYHPVYLYGVTPDREGLTDHPGGLWKDQPTIVEIKTGAMMWWTKVQAALQELTLQAWDVDPVYRERLGVRLGGDCDYEFKHYENTIGDLALAQYVAMVCMSNENKMWQEWRDSGYFASAELI